MSAIGSVIVMVLGLLSSVVSRPSGGWGGTFSGGRGGWSPAGLGDAGELAAVGHLPEADPAEAELAVDGLGPATALATGVAAHRELGLAGRLDPQCCLRHLSASS